MGTNVSEDQSYPAWRLFHITYRVKVPEIYFHDPGWVSNFGRPTSGDKYVDKKLMNGSRTVWWNVADLVEIYSMGAEVSFLNYTVDPFIVYKDIQDHLEEWRRVIRYLQQGLNKYRGDFPIEDLIKFSIFADALFPLVDPSTSGLVTPGRLTKQRTFGRKGRFNKKDTSVKEEEKKDSYELDGSHIFVPDLSGVNEEPVVISEEERAGHIKDNLKDSHHESYTDFFEQFLFSNVAGREED